MKQVLIAFLLFLSLYSFATTDSSFYFTTSDSVRLYVRVAGKGKPCLFVHGGPGSTAFYLEALPSAKLLERELTMIYFDQRGSGRSDSASNNNYSLGRMIQDMEELRRHLRVQKWMVMGHSFAGILLTNYALLHAGNISALLYIHCTLNMQASMQSQVDFAKKELGLQGDTVLSDQSKPLIERVSIVHSELTEQQSLYKLMYRNAYEKQLNDSITFSAGRFNRAFASACWGVPKYWLDYTGKTTGIQCPVLVMTGEQDYAIGTDHYRSFHFPRQTTVHCISSKQSVLFFREYFCCLS